MNTYMKPDRLLSRNTQKNTNQFYTDKKKTENPIKSARKQKLTALKKTIKI